MAGLNWFRQLSPFGQRKSVAFDPALTEFFGGRHVKSGVPVTTDTALQVTTVLACARVIAEDVARLPAKIFRETDDGGRVPEKNHPAYSLLYRQPNEWMTAFEFREVMGLHAVLNGNAYAYIGRAGGKIKELIPLTCGVTVKQASDYTLTYDLSDKNGVFQSLPRKSIMHLRGPSWNGYLGLNAVQMAREAIGLAIATEENHAKLFANGARPGGVLSVEGNLSQAAKDKLKESWAAAQAKLSNAFKTAVIDGNVKWNPMAMTGVDAQHLETRRYQVEEIARAMRVFPQMIGSTDKTTTFASAESFFLAHVVYSISPWTERWEEVIWRDLLDGDVDLYAKFNITSLLRGDAKTRAEFYASAIVNGWMTRNEVRALEEMNPLPGLSEPLIPLNMATQAQVDAMATDVVKTIKSMIGDNGGPSLDDHELELKVGRVLSSLNETRIREASDRLGKVLATLPAPSEETAQ